MPEAWPLSLPQCFNIPFAEGAADGLIETTPDAGPPMSRRGSSAAVRPLTGKMRMTSAQLAALTDFLDTTILGGSLPFTFPDPRVRNSMLLVKFQKGKLPTWLQIGGGKYTVDIQFLVLP